MKYVLEISPQNCAKVFGEHGKVTTDTRILRETPQDVALVVFTGGHDITPELYGENVGKYTRFSWERDEYEGKYFELAFANKIPCVGICRGSQFLCVKSGGKLVQDISGHGGTMHRMVIGGGKSIYVNSSHHQMQLPPPDAIVLGCAEPKLSRTYLNGDNEEIEVEKEYEVVYYPKIKSVGIQYHPEWLPHRHECVLYAQKVVKECLFS